MAASVGENDAYFSGRNVVTGVCDCVLGCVRDCYIGLVIIRKHISRVGVPTQFYTGHEEEEEGIRSRQGTKIGNKLYGMLYCAELARRKEGTF